MLHVHAHANSACLVAELHGVLLRCVCGRLGRHFEGLQQCGRELRRQGASARVAKRLSQLDVVFSWTRHLTAPRASQFVAEVVKELDSLSCGSPLSESDEHVGSGRSSSVALHQDAGICGSVSVPPRTGSDVQFAMEELEVDDVDVDVGVGVAEDEGTPGADAAAGR